MAINFEELDLIVKDFRAFPETHVQGMWISRVAVGDLYRPTARQGVVTADWCGTACCVAGKAVLRAGWKPKFFLAHRPETASVERDGFISTVSREAQQVLGLTNDQADELFEASNTIEDIERIIDEWRAAE